VLPLCFTVPAYHYPELLSTCCACDKSECIMITTINAMVCFHASLLQHSAFSRCLVIYCGTHSSATVHNLRGRNSNRLNIRVVRVGNTTVDQNVHRPGNVIGARKHRITSYLAYESCVVAIGINAPLICSICNAKICGVVSCNDPTPARDLLVWLNGAPGCQQPFVPA
jgi:hypothetical protein